MWLLLAVAAGVLVPTHRALAQDQKQVLVLYSNRRDARIVTVGDRDLPRILNAGHPNGVDYYSEFIDQVRLADTDYIAAFRNFLRLKYGGHAFDLIVAMDDNSQDFLQKTRQELFPTAPVVFFSLRKAPQRLPNSTGVIGELNLTDTLALATQLQPDTRHVFVVSGAETANAINEVTARAQFVPYESHLEFTYLSGLATGRSKRGWLRCRRIRWSITSWFIATARAKASSPSRIWIASPRRPAHPRTAGSIRRSITGSSAAVSAVRRRRLRRLARWRCACCAARQPIRFRSRRST